MTYPVHPLSHCLSYPIRQKKIIAISPNIFQSTPTIASTALCLNPRLHHYRLFLTRLYSAALNSRPEPAPASSNPTAAISSNPRRNPSSGDLQKSSSEPSLKELKRRGMTPGSLLEKDITESKQETNSKVGPTRTISSLGFEKDISYQRKRSMTLNNEAATFTSTDVLWRSSVTPSQSSTSPRIRSITLDRLKMSAK